MATKSEPESFDNLLSRLMDSEHPSEELLRIAAQDTTARTSQGTNRLPANPTKKEKENTSLEEIQKAAADIALEMTAITQSALQKELTNALEPAFKVEDISSNDNDETKRALNRKSRALSTLLTLEYKQGAESNPKRTEASAQWETINRINTLSQLKSQTTRRALPLVENTLLKYQSTPQGRETFQKAIEYLRSITMRTEVFLCGKAGIKVGPGTAAMTSTSLPSQAVEVTAFFSHLGIESFRKATKQFGPEAAKKLISQLDKTRKAYNTVDARGNVTPQTEEHFTGLIESSLQTRIQDEIREARTIQKTAQDWKTRQSENIYHSALQTLNGLFPTQMEEAAKNQLHEKTAEALKEETLPNIEEFSFTEELKPLQRLEKLWKKMQEISKSQEENPELPVAVFRALNEEASFTGRATTMVILQKVLSDKKFLSQFQERQASGEKPLLAGFPLLDEEASLNLKATRLLSEKKEKEEDKSQVEELSRASILLQQAEATIYSNPVISSLSFYRRESILQKANAIISGEEIHSDNNPEETRKLRIVHEQATKMAQELQDQIERSDRTLLNIPQALREAESRTNITRSITTLGRELENNMPNLLGLQNYNPENFEHPLSEEQVKSLSNPEIKRALKTLEDFYHAYSNETSGKAFSDMESALELKVAPSQDRQRLLIGICDGRNPKGETIDLKSAFSLLETTSGHKGLADTLNRTTLQLKRWKRRDVHHSAPKTTELAKGICQLPDAIRLASYQQITNTLRTLCEAPAWNNPARIPNEEQTKNFNQLSRDYLTILSALKEEEKTTPSELRLIQNIRDLQSTMEEAQHQFSSGQARAEHFAKLLLQEDNPLRASLEELPEKILALPSNSKLLEPALEYYQSWNKAMGNTQAIQKEAITLSKEEKSLNLQAQRNVASYLATTLEIHNENLRHMKDLYKAMSTKPEVLTQTYIFQKKNEKNPPRDLKRLAGDLALKREKIQEEMQQVADEINSIENQFEDLQKTAKETHRALHKELEDGKFIQAYDNLIRSRERKYEKLALQHQKLENLEKSLPDIQNPNKGFLQATIEKGSKLSDQKPDEKINSIASALDAALGTRSQKSEVLPIVQPSKSEISPEDALSISEINERIQGSRETLLEVAQCLRENHPQGRELFEQLRTELKHPQPENVLETLEKIRTSYFETLESCERVRLQLNRSSRKGQAPLQEIREQMLRDNPELKSTHNNWVKKMSSTPKKLIDTCATYGINLEEKPQKTKTTEKAKAPQKEEQEKEEVVPS